MAKQDRATCWSITINNPVKADEENIARARQQSGWKVHGQLEKGENGTPHYQLMVTTPQVRFSAVKKAFPRAHIEIARDRTALAKYVQKEDTRIGQIESQSMYPTHSTVMKWYGDYFLKHGEENGGVDNGEYLKIFDKMCEQKIREGYYVESLAVNPQIRSAIQKFGRAIYFREVVRRQTDRQTQENNVEVDIQNAEGWNNPSQNAGSQTPSTVCKSSSLSSQSSSRRSSFSS